MKKQFRNFESAREFARALKLKGSKEWFDYCKSGNKPDDIPSSAQRTYKKEWMDWGDFLGTKYVAHKNREFLSFEKAREFVRKLGLKKQQDWVDYRKSGNKPDDIPSNPNRTYKNEWIDFGDWLGNGTSRNFCSFIEARNFVRELNLKGVKEWRGFTKSKKMPTEIPAYPNRTYKKDFKGMGDWLGTGTVAPKDRTYRSFEDAREFAQNLGLKSGSEWKEYRKSDEIPDDIPSNPNRTYKKDFKGMGDFLGTGTVAPKDKVYRSFTDAREFVIPLNLKGLREWRSYCKSGNKPDDIPTAPEVTYKQDFKGMGDWLGTGRIAERDRLFRSFTDAREFARSLNLKNNTDWQKFIKKNKISDLSVRPDTTYKKKGWKGWGDFLNTGNIAPEDKVYRPFTEARDFVRKLNLKSWPEWREYCNSGNKPDDIPIAPWRTYKEWKKK